MLIPLGLCLPYLWRLLQCIRVHSDTGNRAQLFNALKYSTAFPVIVLSSIKYQARPTQPNGHFGPTLVLDTCRAPLQAARCSGQGCCPGLWQTIA